MVSGEGIDGKLVFNDCLKWWKTNKFVFPILAQLARNFLAIQATSAPTERVFSVASRLIKGTRASLDAEMAGKCLFVSQNWEWYENKLNMVAHVSNEEEEKDPGN